jgi:hypothetical protein
MYLCKFHGNISIYFYLSIRFLIETGCRRNISVLCTMCATQRACVDQDRARWRRPLNQCVRWRPRWFRSAQWHPPRYRPDLVNTVGIHVYCWVSMTGRGLPFLHLGAREAGSNQARRMGPENSLRVCCAPDRGARSSRLRARGRWHAWPIRPEVVREGIRAPRYLAHRPASPARARSAASARFPRHFGHGWRW